MKEQDKAAANLKHLEVQKNIGDTTVTAKVSPCSWMYDGYGLQISVALTSGGTATIHRKQIAFEAATEADVRTLLEGVRVLPCTKCGKPTFDPKTVETRESTECEACVKAAFDAEFEKGQVEERKKIAALDAKQKAKGFTHRIDGWVHPESGGDHPVSFYMTKPTVQQIRGDLRKLGSMVESDFAIVTL